MRQYSPPAFLSALGFIIAMNILGCGLERAESNQLVGLGTEMVGAGEISRAMEYFREALDKDPGNPLAHYYLGYVELQKNNNPGRAVESLQAAMEAGVDSAELHYQLGLAFERLERPSDAESAFADATGRDPSHARAWFRLGEALEERGEIREAIDRYTRSIYNQPRLQMGYHRLAGIYIRYGRPTEAIAVLSNAIANENPRDESMLGFRAQNRADIGHVYMELGEYDRAVDYLQQSLDLRPGVESVSFNLGLALRARFLENGDESDRQAALGHLERASQLCNPAAELARCEALSATLRELRQPAR
jgi:tetratricopeptide (TPR) repeat protein